MKQFMACSMLSFLVYILGAFNASEFNPMKWTNVEGKLWFSFFILVIWAAPMCINYLDNKPNFKN